MRRHSHWKLDTHSSMVVVVWDILSRNLYEHILEMAERSPALNNRSIHQAMGISSVADLTWLIHQRRES